MKLYQYNDYKQYLKSQRSLTSTKFGRIVWIQERVVAAVSEYASSHTTVENILCHGTRSGDEQKLFKKHFPDAFIVGSELYDGAAECPMTVIHDFNEPREEWVGKFDIVYTNSLDHSYSPEKTLGVWAEQLKEGGMLFVEWHPGSGGSVDAVSSGDPFSASAGELCDIAATAGLTLQDKVMEDQTKHKGTLLIFV